MKKAEMGIGTLIIFITFLLIATTVSGFVLRSMGEVQEKEYMAVKKAQTQVSTNLRVIEVSASDGRDGYVNNFSQVMKLAAGSEDMKLKDTLLVMTTYGGTATLSYAGVNATQENGLGGFWTITPQTDNTENFSRSLSGSSYIDPWPLTLDFDLDNEIDYITGGLDGDIAYLSLSSTPISVRLGLCNSSGHFVTNVSDQTYVTRVQADSYTCGGSLNLTSLYLERVLSQGDLGNGFFSVEHLQFGTNPRPGTIQRGDIVKIHYQAPSDIGNEEKVNIRFVPTYGTPTITQFTTPQGLAEQRVYLYP